MLDSVSGKALEQLIEAGHSERDAARASLGRIWLDEEPCVLVDLPKHLVAHTAIRGSTEEPCVPIDAGVEIGYGDTGEEVGDCAHLRAVVYSTKARHRASAVSVSQIDRANGLRRSPLRAETRRR